MYVNPYPSQSCHRTQHFLTSTFYLLGTLSTVLLPNVQQPLDLRPILLHILSITAFLLKRILIPLWRAQYPSHSINLTLPPPLPLSLLISISPPTNQHLCCDRNMTNRRRKRTRRRSERLHIGLHPANRFCGRDEFGVVIVYQCFAITIERADF